MRNNPFFTTEYGVASLILESIPMRREAYILLQSTSAPQKLLEECRAFCVACGAEKIFASAQEGLEDYPLFASILQMNARRLSIGDTDAAVFPVQQETAEQWRQIYNEKMAKVFKAAWISESAMSRLLQEGNAYFIHRNGQLLGIGVASEGEIRAVASVIPGSGADVVRALCHTFFEEEIKVEVASTNTKAIRLYEKLGFISVKELSRWHKIL